VQQAGKKRMMLILEFSTMAAITTAPHAVSTVIIAKLEINISAESV
jgi:hypothetical protein